LEIAVMICGHYLDLQVNRQKSKVSVEMFVSITMPLYYSHYSFLNPN